jgi:hypothetical protein
MNTTTRALITVTSESALPLKVPMIRIESVGADVVAQRVAQPVEALAYAYVFSGGPKLRVLEAFRDGADVEVKVVG